MVLGRHFGDLGHFLVVLGIIVAGPGTLEGAKWDSHSGGSTVLLEARVAVFALHGLLENAAKVKHSSTRMYTYICTCLALSRFAHMHIYIYIYIYTCLCIHIRLRRLRDMKVSHDLSKSYVSSCKVISSAHSSLRKGHISSVDIWA